MTAISILLLALIRPGDVVIHSGPLYAASETIIDKILPQFGVKYLDFPAGASREELDEVMARAKSMGRVALIYLESPANPTNVLVDVEAVAAARAAAFGGEEELPPIAIDNTFLGPLWAKPLAQGADISVYSLTKYAGGHSDLVAGALVGKRSVIDKARMMRNVMGGICDPNTAWMLLRSLETLELRMDKAGENAAKVCEFLRDHPKVEKVGYLGFLEDGSSQADIYRRHCSGAGSTFSLYLKGDEKEALPSSTRSRSPSRGQPRRDGTLASAPAAITHCPFPKSARRSSASRRTWCASRSGSRMRMTSSPISPTH